eukprot:Lankesteria_metandrocarpae@DN3666_c0_g1_i1.p1
MSIACCVIRRRGESGGGDERRQQSPRLSSSSFTCYLESVTIKNFKSYGETEITFGPFKRFSSVIGPNGSGKSNFMDAVAFALGVQSRHLRHQNLADLIYRREAEEASTVNRTAVVTLGLRTGPNTVKVFQRKVTRGAHSSFLIDGVTTSFDHYSDQLTDYRILVKARTFLVFQGDIEEVAQKDPSELAALVDRISGSEALKEDYEAAEALVKRLNNDLRYQNAHKHHADLVCRDLRQQAAEVEDYRAAEEEIRKVTMESYLFKLFVNESAAGEKTKERDELQGSIVTAEKSRDDALLELKKSDAARQLATSDHQRATKAVTKLEAQLETARIAHMNCVEERKFTQRKIGELEDKRKRLFLKKQRQDAAKEEAEDKVHSAESALSALQEDEATLATQGNPLAKLTPAQIESYEAAKRNSREDTIQFESQKKLVGADMRELKSKLKVVHSEIEELREVEVDLQARLDEAVEEHQVATKELKATADKLTDAEGQLKNVEDQSQEHHVVRERLTRELREIEPELLAQESMQSENYRTRRNRQILAKLQDSFPGVYGTVSDLCTPCSRRYNVAVSASLGKYNDHIVVDTWSTATRCISHLQAERCPSMDFIPLDNIQSHALDTRLRTLGAHRTPAIDCINFEAHLRAAFDLALKDTIVVETLNDARRLAYVESKELRISLKVVTLDGEKVLKNGNITFDSSQKSANTFETRALRRLEDKRNKLRKELGSFPETYAGGYETGRMRKLIYNLEREKNVAASREELWSGRVHTLQSELRRMTAMSETKATACAALQSKDEELTDKLDKLLRDSGSVEGKYFAKLSKQVGVPDIKSSEERYFKAVDEVQAKRATAERNLALVNADLNKMSRSATSAADMGISVVEKELNAVTKQEKDLRKTEKTLVNSLEAFKSDTDKLRGDVTEAAERRTTSEVAVQSGKLHVRKLHVQADKLRAHEGVLVQGAEALNNEAMDLLWYCFSNNITLPFVGGDTAAAALRAILQQRNLADDENSTGEDVAMLPAHADMDKESMQLDYDKYLSVDKQKLTGTSTARVREEEVTFIEKIARMQEALLKRRPNQKALVQLSEAEQKFNAVEDKVREFAVDRRRADRTFKQLRQTRSQMFMTCFDFVKNAVERIYNQLTSNRNELDIDDDLDVTNHAAASITGGTTGDNLSVSSSAVDIGGDTGLYSTGGQAFLELDEADSEQPFKTGIQFHVMPPSKRFREIQMLSGGEKSMASLALLFALQTFQGSPFVVLDEVDAALDPVNVTALGAFIKRSTFQVIAISLKDRLYSKADCLFGVYKDADVESSKVLSLNLQEFCEA